MPDWIRHFLTVRPIDSLPRFQMVAEENRRLASYHLRGADRGGENHVVFQYTLEGEGCFELDGRSQRLPPGHGFLTTVCDPRTAYYLPVDSSLWRFCYCCSSGGGIEAAVTEFNLRHGHVFQLGLDHPVIKWLRGCERLGDSTRIGPMQGAELTFNLLQALEDSGSPVEPRRRSLISQATEIIHANPASGLFVADLADRLNVTREHLTRIFTEEIGLTPHAYVTRERMLAACRLLNDPNLSVKEVAARCGYSTTAQFTRVFKRVTRQTPTGFRESGASPLF